MDRTRETRRVGMAATTNGLSRRRHRTSVRDSPEDDGPVELQETARLRDRKKDRDRDRERDRDRDRISSRSSKRRRGGGGERLMHGGSNREDGGEESSEESVNDEEDEDDDDGGGGAGTSMRMLPPSLSNHHHHRKSFPPGTKVHRSSVPSPPVATAAVTTVVAAPWKAPDEMICVSVPRKARSASTKRSHECWASSGGGIVSGGVEQSYQQASISPVRSTGPSALVTPAAAGIGSASVSPAPVSPSSSNASVKKKMKPNGPAKQRPPKSSWKSASSTQDEIEMEIAQVLYGLMNQPQGPTKQEIVANESMSREVNNNNNNINNNNKSTGDAKSRVSSPISNSPSTTTTTTIPQSSSIPATNSNSSATPMSVIAPKRKRPRPVKYEDENPSMIPVRSSPILSSTMKPDVDNPAKVENLDKNSGSAVENGGLSYDLLAHQVVPAATMEPQPLEPVKPENNNHNFSSESKLLSMAEEPESTDLVVTKEEPRSPKKESPPGLRLDDNPQSSVAANKANSTAPMIESQREEKFQIDLMAPPPQSRSSPERDSEIDFVALDPKPVVKDVEREIKTMVKQDEKAVKIGKEDVNVEQEEMKAQVIAEEAESQKPIVGTERNFDLQLDLEKADKDGGSVTASGHKLQQHVQKQRLQQQQQHSSIERTTQSASLPLPISMPSWPTGLPHMGYMAPLQGVVSMDGSAVSPAALQPPQLFFSQPRPKRCATHCYIAQNILYHQQFLRMNSLWPMPAGSALQYGAKPCNVNVVPSTDMHPGRGANTLQDKGQSLAILPGHMGKNKSSQAPNVVDPSQRKQILLQQALPPGAPSNILHGPAFIFPLSQQQAAAAASVRPGNAKSPTVGGTASSPASGSASISATSTAVAGATAMSFNYANMPGNETPYLAILQNGAYPIPIPAHVGATPAYRGAPPQHVPFFTGSFYSSQMLHPSQLQQQQQQQQQQPPSTQSQQSQQGHQNPSVSSGSSSSQKHLQNQQQRPHGSGAKGGNVNSQSFPAPKNQLSQSFHLQIQQQQQRQQNQNVPHQARQLDTELGGEDSPSTADSRVSRANMGILSQNFAMPMQPQNFALLTPTSVGGANSAGANPTEKKQQQPQPQGVKPGVETLPSPAFAMSFASINGAKTAPGLDISSFAQNHSLLQSLPEATRHSYHVMAAAAAAQAGQLQQKKNYRVSEEGKAGGNDGSNVEEDRKAMAAAKAPATTGQSIAFSRSDLTDPSISAVAGNTVIDSSARTFNLASTPARASGPVLSATMSTVNAPSMQQLQIMQLKHQNAVASARSKTPATSNGGVYSDHITSSSSIATKFPNALSAFPQNLVQSSSSPAQSPQWKNSARTPPSQVPSSSLASNPSSLKNLPQQQGRTQQGHTQISFATNPKPSTAQHGQTPPNSSQSPSPPVMVGSPTTSSVSKSTGGSPRTTSTSTSNKGGQSSTLSSQQAKNSPSLPAQKSSPVGGRNVPSMLGHPHNTTSSSSSSTKQQLSQQQQHQQLPKHALPQAPMLYTHPYMQAQVQHAASVTNTVSTASGFYLQRHRMEQQQQQSQGSSASSSTGLLSLCPPVTLANTGTTDPAKAAAVAAAACNMKGGVLPSQSLIHTQFAAAQPSGKQHQLVTAPFPYGVPTAVQVKPSEQKQPAGE